MSSAAPTVMRGEVWYAQLDPVTGHEQGGDRPCLVVSNNMLNQSPSLLVTVLPITRKERPLPTRIEIVPPNGGCTERSFIICEQIRTVSKDRLRRRCGDIHRGTMQLVESVLKQILAIPSS